MFRIAAACFVLLLAGQCLPISEANDVEIGPVHLSRFGPAGASFDSRIVGGSLASAGQFPFQVAVYGSRFPNDPEIFCGGSLISSTAVLTAAHCASNYTYFDVVLGSLRPLDVYSAGRVQVKTTNVKIHPQFDYFNGFKNDIAILILPTPVVYTSTIQPVLLPKRRDVGTTFDYCVATTSGWGKTSDGPGWANENLLHVAVDVITNTMCIQSYGPVNVTPEKVCVSSDTGKKGPCHGDSGGPMFLTHNNERVQIGLVSFGASAGCQSGFPNVYTRITSYLDWIAANGGPAVRN